MADPSSLPTPMPIVRTVADLRGHVATARARGQRVALVPTMGALHDGHLSLVRRAAAENDCVVVSLFVNPTQFNDPRDLAAYPRAEAEDARLVAEAGATLLFAPEVAEVYPRGFDTTVDVGTIALPLEGATRGPVHFRGVATVVAKLFNMARPDTAYFGQKDYQQTLVIRRMTTDLDLPVALVIVPTVREPDGLAMSSRNARLAPAARAQAVALVEALRAMADAVHRGVGDRGEIERAGRDRLHARAIEDDAIDYVAYVDPDTLADIAPDASQALLAVAVHVGGVRLIDNMLVRLRASATLP